MAETCSRRQVLALNPIRQKIQTRDFVPNDVNAQDLGAFFRTLYQKKSTQSGWVPKKKARIAG